MPADRRADAALGQRHFGGLEVERGGIARRRTSSSCTEVIEAPVVDKVS